MAYKDGNSPSVVTKLVIAVLTMAGTIYAASRVMKEIQAGWVHQIIMLSCILIFYVRLVSCLFVFIKRKVGWVEGVSVGALYGFLLAMFSIWWAQKSSKNNAIEIAGVILFITGSVVNSMADYQRHQWKKQPGNRGKLYTKGLFRFAMHINFFGDSIMFLGFATITQNGMSFIPVAVIVLNFIFIQIPQLDKYLKGRYGEDFVRYASVTKKFIPFIY